MANKLVYKIESSKDRNGNDKALPIDWINREYTIHSLTVGRSAFLANKDKYIQTSTVEDIKIWDNSVIITTRNTVYTLSPEVTTDEQN